MSVPLSSDWSRACVPFGPATDNRWSPLGTGILLVQRPVVWLVTLDALVPEGAALSAWVSPENDGTLFDLGDLHRHTGLSWIRGGGYAAALCPVKPEWKTKALNAEQSVLDPRLAVPMTPTCTVQYHYTGQGVFGGGPAAPHVISGVVTRNSVERLFCSLPLFARNAGAPVFAVVNSAQGGEPEVRLLGLAEQAAERAPLPLSSVLPIAAAFELLQSDEAQAQVSRVVPSEV
ncbi:MAG: hypothetical protein R3F62_21725 [Planctomycetota bacterium]